MRRRRFNSFLGGAALAPLTALPVYAAPPDGCGVPAARDDGWPVASANDDKLVDRGALCRMADRLVASGANVHAVLVARGGGWCSSGTSRVPTRSTAAGRGTRRLRRRYIAQHKVGFEERRVARPRDRDRSRADTQRRRTDLELLPRAGGPAFPGEGPPPAGARAHHVAGPEVGGGGSGQREATTTRRACTWRRTRVVTSSVFR